MIRDLPRNMRRLGRIRMGAKVRTEAGKVVPSRLETWRLTSPVRELLEAATALYGGDVNRWDDAPPGVGEQWELFTEAASLDVIIPPTDMAFSQWYELWTAAGIKRRCDGFENIVSGGQCECPADPDERRALANDAKACKPTTRLFVIMPRLPDMGIWHFESHGFYAAVELAGSVEVLRHASAVSGLIPANLRIEQRTTKSDGKTQNFSVPVLELPTLTPHTLMTGEIRELTASVPAVPPLAAGTDAQPGPTTPSGPAGPPSSGQATWARYEALNDLQRSHVRHAGMQAGLPALPRAIHDNNLEALVEYDDLIETASEK